MIHVDDEARSRLAIAMAARDFFAQAGLQVFTAVPSGERVHDARAEQACPIEKPLDSRDDLPR